MSLFLEYVRSHPQTSLWGGIAIMVFSLAVNNLFKANSFRSRDERKGRHPSLYN